MECDHFECPLDARHETSEAFLGLVYGGTGQYLRYPADTLLPTNLPYTVVVDHGLVSLIAVDSALIMQGQGILSTFGLVEQDSRINHTDAHDSSLLLIWDSSFATEYHDRRRHRYRSLFAYVWSQVGGFV